MIKTAIRNPSLYWRRTTESCPVAGRSILGGYADGGTHVMRTTRDYRWYIQRPSGIFDYVETPEFWLPLSSLPPVPQERDPTCIFCDRGEEHEH